MDNIAFDAAPYRVRDDLTASHAAAWDWMAAPGTWLTGAERIAVAAEVRQAHDCALCRDRKEALSPFAIDGRHDGRYQLAENEIEAVHRIATDPGRLRRQWLEDLFAAGLAEGAYVEISAIVAMTMMMDSFTRALGIPQSPLPAPGDGEPTKYHPPGAKKGEAWVALLAPEDIVASDGIVYPAPRAAYVQQALSSVPDAKRAYWALAEAHYLPGPEIQNWTSTYRAISRPQIEVIAARVSALHTCFY